MGHIVSTKVSLGEHLRELRSRLLVITASFIFWCLIAYFIRKPVVNYILKPLGQAVYYTTPQGGFEFVMRVVITLGFIASVPIMVYQLLRFLEPAISTRVSNKLVSRLLLGSSLLVLCGVAFGYLIILPTSLEFFAKFGGAELKSLISADQYLNFVLGILAAFAIIFQLPMVISITDHVKPLDPKNLSKYRRHIIIGSLVVALVLPFTYDPVTQFVVALPIIVLYELSILIVRYHHRIGRDKKRQNRIHHLVELMEEADAAKNKAQKTQPVSQTQPIRAVEKPPVPKQRRAHVIDLRNIN